MDTRSEIKPTAALIEWAAEPIVESLISEIRDDEFFPVVETTRSDYNRDEFEGLNGEFLSSESYQALCESEKLTVARALRAFSADEPAPAWGIEGNVSDDNLLGLRTVTKVPSRPSELLIVYGATLLDIDRIRPNFWLDNPQQADRRIEFANMVGVALMSGIGRQHGGHEPNSYDYALSPFANVEVMIGGDVHGDFRMAQREVYPEGAIDPIGNKVMYAPHGNIRSVAAYHSSEPEILECLIKHLDVIGLDNSSQKEIISAAIQGFTEAETKEKSPFGGAFADYGDEDNLDFYLSRLRCYFKDKDTQDAQDIIEGETYFWSNVMVRPQSSDRLQVRTDRDAFVMQNVRYDDEGAVAEKFGSIEVRPEQIGLFMRSLLHQTAQGAGRTAPTALLSLLSTRLELLG
jgi:hypothetical protein